MAKPSSVHIHSYLMLLWSGWGVEGETREGECGDGETQAALRSAALLAACAWERSISCFLLAQKD